MATRENPAPLKVIGVGLGRTGTLSLCMALDRLGFGPCHHPCHLGVSSDFWIRMAKAARAEKEGGACPEVLDDLFCGYVAAVDSTAAILAESLHRAYPDAKFILTTRDPAKWAQSMSKTILRVAIESKAREERITRGTATKKDRILFESMTKLGMLEWQDACQQGYHQGRLSTDPEDELKRHNEYIMQLIPPKKLLIFDVSEGWEPLAKFLGVPVPDEPFPRLNDAVKYEQRGNEWLEKLTEGFL